MFGALSDDGFLSQSDIPASAVRLEGVGEKSYLLDHLSNRQIKRPGVDRRSDRKPVEDHIFHSNEEFWGNVLSKASFSGLRNLALEHFRIVDWFPRSPGLAFTRHGQDQQNRAQRYIDERDPSEYLPRGKMEMINGGIGSYRFNLIEWKGEEFALCTATSDNFCHTGIPLAVPINLFEHLNLDRGYRIIGRYVPIPSYLRCNFQHLIQVPKFFIRVEGWREQERRDAPIFLTPVVFMKTAAGESIASYCRCEANSRAELERAADWLQRYAQKYNARIYTDYDEQLSFFEDAEFSLQRVMNDDYDIQDLSGFGFTQTQIAFIAKRLGRVTVNINNENKGNQNIAIGSQINGSMVAGNHIQNSFNQIASSPRTDEIKDLLNKLTEQVDLLTKAIDDEEEVTEVKQELETFLKEATREKPRENHLQVSIESIKRAAENIRDVGKPVLEIVGKILPLLIALSK